MTMFWAKIMKRKFICHYFLTILTANKKLTGFHCILIANEHILHNTWWWLIAVVKIYGVIGNIRAGYLKTEMWVSSHHFVHNSQYMIKLTNHNCDNSYEETYALHKCYCRNLYIYSGGSTDLLVSLIVKVEMHFPNNNLVFFLSCDCRMLNPHPQCTQKPFRERMCIRRNAS